MLPLESGDNFLSKTLNSPKMRARRPAHRHHSSSSAKPRTSTSSPTTSARSLTVPKTELTKALSLDTTATIGGDFESDDTLNDDVTSVSKQTFDRRDLKRAVIRGSTKSPGSSERSPLTSPRFQRSSQRTPLSPLTPLVVTSSQHGVAHELHPLSGFGQLDKEVVGKKSATVQRKPTWKRSTTTHGKDYPADDPDASFFAHRRQKSMTLPASVGKRKQKQSTSGASNRADVSLGASVASSLSGASVNFFHKSREFIRKKSEWPPACMRLRT